MQSLAPIASSAASNPLQKTSITIALESIAAFEDLAPHETSAGMLHERVLRHYSEGLRQYLTLRVLNVEVALALAANLREQVLAWPAERLTAPPTSRAHLYQLARKLAFEKRVRKDFKESPRAALPWRSLAQGTPHTYVQALNALRITLSDLELELLELRYARELSPEEIACVLDLKEAEVSMVLAQAQAHAQQLLGDAPPSRLGGLAGALVEAFALNPDVFAALTKPEEKPGLEKGAVLGDRFEIERRVGEGAFSDVYRARDKHVPGHVVALKLLHHASLSDTARESALRELHLIASVFHPSVVHFKDHGWYAGRLWFTMPWYEGEALETRIARAPLTRVEARRIFEPLAKALATLHTAGIRHQDIKPDNIFLARIRSDDEQDEVLPVLLDLGVAAREAEVLIAGTPMYFAPEVAARFARLEHAPPIGQKADVFALALSLRNALEPETQEDIAAAAVDAFIEHRALNPPKAPSKKDLHYLEPFFHRWLALDADARPSADVFAKELAKLTEPEEKRARLITALKRIGPIAAALMVAVCAVVYVLWKERNLQQLEAERARGEAAYAKAELSQEEAKLKSLSAGHQDLLEQYKHGKLTQKQLADRLNASERQIRSLLEQLGFARTKANELETSLKQTQLSLAQAQEQLVDDRERIARLEGDLSASKQLVSQLQDDLAGERTKSAEANATLSTVRDQLGTEQLRVSELTRNLDAAKAEQARLERQVADLRQSLEANRQPAPTVPSETP